jgi:hypothetical protein
MEILLSDAIGKKVRTTGNIKNHLLALSAGGCCSPQA